MSKGLIAFIVVAAVVLMFFIMKESANIARNKSDDIVEHFKTIEGGLNKTSERLDSFNKMDIDSLIKANK